MKSFGGTGEVCFLIWVLVTQMCLHCEHSLIGGYTYDLCFSVCVCYISTRKLQKKKMMVAMNTTKTKPKPKNYVNVIFLSLGILTNKSTRTY